MAARNSSQYYQLDLVTPGISPARARFRKQMRQSWNFLKYPLGRPQRLQRFDARTLNFGLRLALAIMHVFATITPCQEPDRGSPRLCRLRRAFPESVPDARLPGRFPVATVPFSKRAFP